jgi:hypothetical protein
MYLVVNGSFIYKKKIQIELPVDSTTKNKWFKDEIKFKGFNQKLKTKDIAIFENNELIGLEEILRYYILMHTNDHCDHIKEPEMKVLQRDFTCLGLSQVSEVLFFSKDIIMPIIKIHDIKFMKKVF